MADTKTSSGLVSIQLAAEGLPESAIDELTRSLQNTLLTNLAELAVGKVARVELRAPDPKLLTRPTIITDGIVATIDPLE